MSTKRTTAARKRALKERRREAVEQWHADSSDTLHGIRVGTGRGGRTKLEWTIEHDPFLGLMGLHQLRSYVDGLEVEMAANLRSLGVSWVDIGWTLQVSGEAVRKRLGAAVERRLDEKLGEGQ
jgi:hypothetical protein